jgi:hypothetical protein
MNLYAYVGNDPINRNDPTGTYGRGTGFADDEWKKFDRVQQRAATDMERSASKLDTRADKLDAKGKSGGGELRAAAGHLREGAAALRSDGSDGKMANMVDGATYQAAGGDPNGAAGVPPSNRDIMLVNRDNAKGFFSSTEMAKWIAGHESLHTAGLSHAFGSNDAVAYKFGEPPQRAAFKELRGTERAYSNPDHLMELVYPRFWP